MARAEILLPTGTKVTVEGSSEEIQAILAFYSSLAPRKKIRDRSRKRVGEAGSNEGERIGPKAHIRELKQEGFFNSKQTLKSVHEKLAEKGHTYSPGALSAALLRLTQERELGRVKEDGMWTYIAR